MTAPAAPARPLHLVEVRRRGCEHHPLRWRAFCCGCKTWRLGRDGSYAAWSALMSDAVSHTVKGRWP